MKIVQFVTQLEVGGAQVIASELDREFNSVQRCKSYALYRKSEANSIKNIEPIFSKKITRPSEFLKLISAISSIILRAKPDSIICHSHYSSFVVLPIAFLLGVKKRAYVQHLPYDSLSKTNRVVDYILVSSGIINKKIFVSEKILDSSPKSKRYRIKSLFIRNGVSLPKTEIPEIRKQIELAAQGRPIMLNIGRNSHQKNQAFLIDLAIRDAGFFYVIVGEGPLRGVLRSKILESNLSGQVLLLDNLSREGINTLFELSDVFLFPSIYEAAPLSILEAISKGVKIIANDEENIQYTAGDEATYLPLEAKLWIENLRKAVGSTPKNLKSVYSSKEMSVSYMECLK